jgi:hypothetical protein
VIEVNARSGGGNDHARVCGFNHILLGYREAIGESITPLSSYEPYIYSMDMLSDILTVSQRLRQRRLFWSAVARSYIQKHNDWLFRSDDFAPFIKQLQILFSTKVLARLDKSVQLHTS